MSLKIAPVELRVLTKCFSASNQIVKDLRELPQESKYLKKLQASKLAPTRAYRKDGKTHARIYSRI